MQSTPSEAGRLSAAEPRIDPSPDPSGTAHHDTVLPARERQSTPAVVLRPRLAWRLPGPVLLLVGAVLAAPGRWWGLALVPIALPFLPTLWIRLVVSELSVRRRSWPGRRTTILMDSVDTMRLRRLPFAATGWAGRGYRIGRFWSVPLTLRLQHGEDIKLEIRCVWWKGWRNLARFVTSQPGIALDERTRGRYERYVGPPATVTSVQL